MTNHEAAPVVHPYFETLPRTPVVLKRNQLEHNPTYSGLLHFLNEPVGNAEPQDMGGTGTIRTKPDTPEDHGHYEIRFKEPFLPQYHDESWEALEVMKGKAIILLGGTLKEWVGGTRLAGGFEQRIPIVPGDVVVIPPGTPHGIELMTNELEANVVMSPPHNSKDSFKFQVTAE